MPEIRFIGALDVLFSRGNKVFGDSGQHGEAQIPPWPSVVAGAIRSRMLADAGVDSFTFARGEHVPDTTLHAALGTPAEPGAFRIAWFSVARRVGGKVEPLIALPADLAAAEHEDAIRYLHSNPLPQGFTASAATECLAVLQQPRSAKLEGGLWLNAAGLAAYLRGEPLGRQAHTARTSEIWKTDQRIGIALDPEKRSAAERRLYTAEAVALGEDVGFVASVEGADGRVPSTGLLRFGGDGRGARIEACELLWAHPEWDRLATEKKFRLVLATPGVFEQGWLLPGMQPDGATWRGPDGVTARLVSAAVPRAQVISGWDLAKWSTGNPGPKPALRAAPAGSVYWLEAADADGAVLLAALRKLAAHGFGCLSGYPDRARLVEGFNNVMVANWTEA